MSDFFERGRGAIGKSKKKKTTQQVGGGVRVPVLCSDCPRYQILQTPCDNTESCFRLQDKNPHQ